MINHQLLEIVLTMKSRRHNDMHPPPQPTPPSEAAKRPMMNSKRPMSERHGPHDQNKTPHEEIIPIAA
jgi:hypothetical protein